MQKQIKIHFRIHKQWVRNHSTELLIDVFQHAFEMFKGFGWSACYSNGLLMVQKSQICFNVKLNMLLCMHSILVSMFIMFPLIKLRNYMVPGQNKPQTLN